MPLVTALVDADKDLRLRAEEVLTDMAHRIDEVAPASLGTLFASLESHNTLTWESIFSFFDELDEKGVFGPETSSYMLEEGVTRLLTNPDGAVQINGLTVAKIVRLRILNPAVEQ